MDVDDEIDDGVDDDDDEREERGRDGGKGEGEDDDDENDDGDGGARDDGDFLMRACITWKDFCSCLGFPLPGSPSTQ